MLFCLLSTVFCRRGRHGYRCIFWRVFGILIQIFLYLFCLWMWCVNRHKVRARLILLDPTVVMYDLIRKSPHIFGVHANILVFQAGQASDMTQNDDHQDIRKGNNIDIGQFVFRITYIIHNIVLLFTGYKIYCLTFSW